MIAKRSFIYRTNYRINKRAISQPDRPGAQSLIHFTISNYTRTARACQSPYLKKIPSVGQLSIGLVHRCRKVYGVAWITSIPCARATPNPRRWAAAK
jgi:hypothetical protein